MVGDREVDLVLDVDRRVLEVVLRQEGDQLADVLDGVVLVRRQVVGVAGLRVVGAAPAELFERDVLAGHGLDDLGTGDEHLRRLVDHDDEVGERRAVHVAAGRRAHDQRDLRDHAARERVPAEDLRVQAERDDALLDPRAATFVDADDRHAGLEGEVEDLADLLPVHLAERAAEDHHVLREHAHRAAVDRAGSGDDAVAVRTPLLQAEVRRAVPRELVELGEGPLVEKSQYALAGGHLALGVLLLDGRGRRGMDGFLDPSGQVGGFAGCRVDVDVHEPTP